MDRVPFQERGLFLRSEPRSGAVVRGLRKLRQEKSPSRADCGRPFKTSVISLIVALQIAAPDTGAA